MAFLGKMFGGGAKPAPKSSRDVIDGLGEQEDLMDKRIALLQRRVDNEVTQARDCLAKGTPAARKQAKNHLARKGQLQKQVDQLEAQKQNMFGLKLQTEESAMQADYLKNIQAATQHIKHQQQQVGIDKIDDIRDELQDVMQTHQEMNDILAQPFGDQVDDEDLEAELGELEQEVLGEQMAAPSAAKLPPVPQAAKPQAAPAKASEEDQALADLEAELAAA